MDNYEYTATYNEEELYKQYDGIIGATVINIFSFSKNNNKIIFNNFDYKNKIHRVFLESAFLLSTTHKMDIYLNMPLFPFLYFKYFIIKKRNDKIFRIKENQENGINIEEVAKFEAESYNHSVYVFDDIYNAYYRKIYKRR